ncbi:hypothetical protein [Pseudonocardia ammonioxydans]|nr:hypothetical protein [Pseudonocardia ammonioxydans]
MAATGRADIPLHVDKGEIHAAARTPLTHEQARVLGRMRNAIGSDTV